MNNLNPTQIAVFDDVRNYVYGKARIIWADETLTNSGERLPAGWVLPGGRRTNDIGEVASIARWIDNLHKREQFICI